MKKDKQNSSIKSKQVKREFSAGGVVYRKLKTKSEKLKIVWLLCKHSGYHKWGFPKGLVEEGESLRETALREVEESGVKTRIVDKIIDPEQYVYIFDGVKVFKQVNYFLMEYVSGDIKDHDWEMEEVEWLEFDEALERLDFPGAKKILAKARKLKKEKENQLKLL